MSRLLVPLMPCAAPGVATPDTHTAGEVMLISATQVGPGEVVVQQGHSGADRLHAEDPALRLDGGREVPAATLTAAPAAAGALLLCLDRSGSMGPPVAAMHGALRTTLISDSGSGTLPFSVAITAFGTRTVRLLGLTNDASRVASALARLQVERERDGKTLLDDAMAGGLAELRAAEEPVKRLLGVSDGNDEGSGMSRKTVVSRAVAAPSMPIDAVGSGPRAASSSGLLSMLAEASGGPLPGKGRTVAVLRVVSGTGCGWRLAVTRAKVSLGSAADDDTLEGDDLVSGHPAVVRAEAGNLYVLDVGSSNGTELHGVRFKDGTRAPSPGHRFALGRTVLEVTTADVPQRPGSPGFEHGVR